MRSTSKKQLWGKAQTREAELPSATVSSPFARILRDLRFHGSCVAADFISMISPIKLKTEAAEDEQISEALPPDPADTPGWKPGTGTRVSFSYC